MEFKGNFSATGIGSLPHTDAGEACELVLSRFGEIPFWPQLPKRSFYENMYVQFSERLPGVRIDPESGRIIVDTKRDIFRELEILYERYLAGDIDYFAAGAAYASGLFEFERRLARGKPSALVAVKGQVTGPVSFGLTVTDENKRSIIYDPDLKEAVFKSLSMKARWQARRLFQISGKVIIFIDEPYLVSVGSSVVNIQRSDVIEGLDEIASAVHDEGALCGIHCCGNTDWGLVLSSDIDILNFDAYDYAGSVALYPEAVGRFLRRGGLLAWGIVPTSNKALAENAESLLNRLIGAIDGLAGKGIDKKRIIGASLITPSCGCGSLTVDHTKTIFDLTAQLSEMARDRITA